MASQILRLLKAKRNGSNNMLIVFQFVLLSDMKTQYVPKSLTDCEIGYVYSIQLSVKLFCCLYCVQTFEFSGTVVMFGLLSLWSYCPYSFHMLFVLFYDHYFDQTDPRHRDLSYRIYLYTHNYLLLLIRIKSTSINDLLQIIHI